MKIRFRRFHKIIIAVTIVHFPKEENLPGQIYIQTWTYWIILGKINIAWNDKLCKVGFEFLFLSFKNEEASNVFLLEKTLNSGKDFDFEYVKESELNFEYSKCKYSLSLNNYQIDIFFVSTSVYRAPFLSPFFKRWWQNNVLLSKPQLGFFWASPHTVAKEGVGKDLRELRRTWL